MQNRVEIEDIEAMRRQEGIEDVELREDIRGLQAGDFIKLTFLFGPKSAETLLVRITSIRGAAFRGKVTGDPTRPGPSKLRPGSMVVFTAAHIHSIAKRGTKRTTTEKPLRVGVPRGQAPLKSSGSDSLAHRL